MLIDSRGIASNIPSKPERPKPGEIPQVDMDVQAVSRRMRQGFRKNVATWPEVAQVCKGAGVLFLFALTVYFSDGNTSPSRSRCTDRASALPNLQVPEGCRVSHAGRDTNLTIRSFPDQRGEARVDQSRFG